MARAKSELLGSMGVGFEIIKAISDAVRNRGGSDDHVRRILKDKRLGEAIADILVVDSSVFDFEVDYGDPRWKESPVADRPHKTYDGIRLEHFPVTRTGKAEVTVELITFKRGISFNEYRAKCGSWGIPMPDRAITETFFDTFSDDDRIKYMKGFLYALCGSFVEESYVGYINIFSNSLLYETQEVNERCEPWVKILIVREIRPLND